MSETGAINGTGALRPSSNRARVESVPQTAASQRSVVRGEARVPDDREHPTVEYGGPRIPTETVHYPELALNNRGPRPTEPPAEAVAENAPKYEDDERYGSATQDMTKEQWEESYFAPSEGSVFDDEKEPVTEPEAEPSPEETPTGATNASAPESPSFTFSPLIVLNQAEQGQVVLERIKELEIEQVKKNLREFELRVLEQEDSKEYAEVCQQRNLYGYLISKYVAAYNSGFPPES